MDLTVPITDTIRLEAARAGVTVDEYQARIGEGLLWCYRCNFWQPAKAFPADARRHTGRGSSCVKSVLAAMRDSAAAEAPPQIWVVRRPVAGGGWEYWRGGNHPAAWSPDPAGYMAKFADAQQAAEALVAKFGAAEAVPEGCSLIRLT